MINKAAMFGLESRAFRKQFGKLFLARMQSVDSQETRGARIQSNRAAMFGLDARIALAIFGALSVISGAALYSAIQNAKATAIITEINEVGKAWEAYMLDTGFDISRYTNDSSNNLFYVMNMEDLINNPGVNGWSGPYLAYKNNTHFIEKDSSGNSRFYMLQLTNEETWAEPNDWQAGICSSGKKCFLWIQFNVHNLETMNLIDKKIDGSLSATSGSIRWYYRNDSRNYRAFYKYSPIKNPNS